MYKIKFCFFSAIICFLTGCAIVRDMPRGLAGLSTRAVENAREDALASVFDYDYDTCYKKTVDILVQIQAYVYARPAKKDMLAIYVSSSDTTEVGIFFAKVGQNKTRVEISSLSTPAKERLSKRIFAMLGGLPDPEKKTLEEVK
ncbi:MAG: hypothetical protein ABIG46_03360 [Candidatus Omnitrophota bacterium]